MDPQELPRAVLHREPRASTTAAPITTRPGAASAATNSTAASPARTSRIVDNPWLDAHIRAKGPLGAQYPQVKFLMEGDTPSFLGLIGNGLNAPEHPDWGGWGGRYEFYTPRMQKWFNEPETRPFWTDAEDEVLGVDGNWHTSNHATIWRWRQAYQNDFAARMDWTIKPYAAANHPPVAQLAHAERLDRQAGERVALSAAGSTDPDGNRLVIRMVLLPRARIVQRRHGPQRRASRHRTRERTRRGVHRADEFLQDRNHAHHPGGHRRRHPRAHALPSRDRDRQPVNGRLSALLLVLAAPALGGNSETLVLPLSGMGAPSEAPVYWDFKTRPDAARQVETHRRAVMLGTAGFRRVLLRHSGPRQTRRRSGHSEGNRHLPARIRDTRRLGADAKFTSCSKPR